MSLDTTNLPISGGVLVAAALYVGASIFVTGPLIATRTIDRSDWGRSCHANIHSTIAAQKTPAKVIPRTDCQSLIGGFMPELGRLCQQYGNPDFGGGTSAMMREQERRRQEVEAKRLQALAASSASRCDCAASVFAQDRSWAVHAGSFRLVSPPAVKHMKAELQAALQSPLCRINGT